ncbi:MAG: PAS domain-containing protein [Candidatus Saccharimonadales bacterium]
MSTASALPADNLISCFNESTTDCVKVLDTDAMILSFNPAGYEIMEIDDPSMAIGADWLTFWKGEQGIKAQRAFNDAKTGKLGYFEGESPTMRGNMKWWQVTIVPLKNSHNDIEWILVMSRDVTELHDLRSENKALKLKLT